jgi:hypothetical protein
LKDTVPAELERLRETSKADLFTNSLGETIKLSLQAAGQYFDEQSSATERSATTAA